jgi:hypothetical protein
MRRITQAVFAILEQQEQHRGAVFEELSPQQQLERLKGVNFRTDLFQPLTASAHRGDLLVLPFPVRNMYHNNRHNYAD